jgi:hypothetical protein
MPQHPYREPAEKLDQGVTVLFTRTQRARIVAAAKARGISFGRLVREAVEKDLRGEQD